MDEAIRRMTGVRPARTARLEAATGLEVDWFLVCAGLIAVLTLVAAWWICGFTAGVDEIALKSAGR